MEENKFYAILDQDNLVIHALVFPSNPETVINFETGEEYTPTPNDLLASFQNCTLQEYGEGITNNLGAIGYTYDSFLNAFIPPQPDSTYILNTQTYLWEPDPELIYDLHQNGEEYKWDGVGWYRVN